MTDDIRKQFIYESSPNVYVIKKRRLSVIVLLSVIALSFWYDVITFINHFAIYGGLCITLKLSFSRMLTKKLILVLVLWQLVYKPYKKHWII